MTSTIGRRSLLAAAALGLGTWITPERRSLAVPSVLRIGYQKSGTLAIVRYRGELERQLEANNIKLAWVEFTSGPLLLEALAARSIDFGFTGETPPVFAQAAGVNLVYLGCSPPRPRSQAILVPRNSPVTKLSDLKGTQVAFTKGSSAHYLVVRALESAKLSYRDIQPVFLAPPDARAAFERGSLAAWGIWDPFMTSARRGTGARAITDSLTLTAHREYYLSSRTFASSNSGLLKLVLTEIQATARWASANPESVVKLLAPVFGLDLDTLREAESNQRYGVLAFDAALVAEQQHVADTFLKLGLIPKPIRIAEAIYSL